MDAIGLRAASYCDLQWDLIATIGTGHRRRPALAGKALTDGARFVTSPAWKRDCVGCPARSAKLQVASAGARWHPSDVSGRDIEIGLGRALDGEG